MNVVTNEVVNVIKKIDFVKEAARFVEEHKFRVTAEIEVLKRDTGAPASASAASVDAKNNSTDL